MPYLGSGLSYRSVIHDKIISNRKKIDFLEVIPDQFIYSNEKAVSSILDDLKVFPIVSHGINLSIGTVGGINQNYLEKVIEFIKKSGSVCYSEHVCFTKAGGIDLGQLGPLQFSREIADAVVLNVEKVFKKLGSVPFYLENISYYLDVPGSEFSETEFLTYIVEKTGSGLLLDLNNLYVNSVNRNYDPYKFLAEVPLERVQLIHIAGHKKYKELLLDSHDSPLSEEVWKLLRFVAKKAPIKGVLLEQDENLENFDLLLDQIDQARHIMKIIKH
jgi:uncharacterized protein